MIDAAGSLVGQCLADALGFPVEGQPPEICAAHVAYRFDDPPGRGPYPFGQYTDDSQLARELVQSFVACRGFNPVDYGARIAAIFHEERIVGRGRATENAAGRLLAGVPWDRAGEPAPSAGNGSAMRAGPVGLVFTGARLVEVAACQGRITHQDPRCSAGAVAIAAAVSLADADPTTLPDALVAATHPVDASVAAAIAQLPAWIRLPPDEAVRPIAALAVDAHGWRGISPFVTSSVVWSLYSFLRTPDDYLATVRTAIAVGGDVDTTAAMAGAIAGARVGLANLPPLARRVTDQGTWGHDELVALAQSLTAITNFK